MLKDYMITVLSGVMVWTRGELEAKARELREWVTRQLSRYATGSEVDYALDIANTAKNAADTAKNAADTAKGIADKSVQFSSQSLSDVQKKTARDNIGAGTSNFSGMYKDLTGKPKFPYNFHSDVLYDGSFSISKPNNAGTWYTSDVFDAESVSEPIYFSIYAEHEGRPRIYNFGVIDDLSAPSQLLLAGPWTDSKGNTVTVRLAKNGANGARYCVTGSAVSSQGSYLASVAPINGWVIFSAGIVKIPQICLPEDMKVVDGRILTTRKRIEFK